MKKILIRIKNKEEWVSVLNYLFSKGYIWAGGSGTKLRFSYYNAHKTIFLEFHPAHKESIMYGHSLDFQEGELYSADKFLKGWKNEYVKVNDTDRISHDDIGNDIHEFLHGGDK